jgi:hypothetical protein
MKQIVLAVLIGLSLVVVPAWAQDNPGNLGNPGIVPPQASFGGQTYSEWVASLFQWVFSIQATPPAFTDHPLFDAADCMVGTPKGCSIGQSGNVWFLDGRLGSGGSVNRCCTIPAGTALFLMITGSEFDNASCDPTDTFVQLTSFTEDQLRGFAAVSVDGLLSGGMDHMSGRGQCVIDGRPVQNLPGPNPSTPTSPYRVQSPKFDYTLPPLNNLDVLIDGNCYQRPPVADLTVVGAVADGLFVLIEPLPVGVHHIVFGRELSRQYFITVSGPLGQPGQ